MLDVNLIFLSVLQQSEVGDELVSPTDLSRPSITMFPLFMCSILLVSSALIPETVSFEGKFGLCVV